MRVFFDFCSTPWVITPRAPLSGPLHWLHSAGVNFNLATQRLLNLPPPLPPLVPYRQEEIDGKVRVP